MTDELKSRLESLRRAVAFGVQNGKKNVIADLDVLAALFTSADEAEHLRGHLSGITRIISLEAPPIGGPMDMLEAIIYERNALRKKNNAFQ